MRKSYLLLLAFIVLSGMFCNVYADFPKMTLIERFTGINCTPCADLNQSYGYSSWVEANDTKAVIITYHVPWPASDVPEVIHNYNTAMPYTRADYYGANSVPSVYLNSNAATLSTSAATNKATFDRIVSQDQATRVPMSITPTLEIVDGVANVSVEVFSEEAMDNIRLQILILESPVLYATAPGNNGENSFPYVARHALPNMDGENFTISAEETKTFTHTQTLSSELKQNRLYVVAFVEAASGGRKVIQTGMSSAPSKPERVFADITFDGGIYHQAKKDEIVTHNLKVTNTCNYELEVTLSRNAETSSNWEVVSSSLPTEKVILAPEEFIDIVQEVKYIGTEPSSWENIITATAAITQEALSEITFDFEPFPETIQYPFVDVSNNTKYAFLVNYDVHDYAYFSADAFDSTDHIAGKLVNVSFYSPQFFATDIPIIDSLEFLGMNPNPVYFLNDENSTTLNRIKTLPKLKVFLGLHDLTYRYHNTIYPQYGAEPNAFLHDVFGVSSTESPYYINTLNAARTDYARLVITGVKDDSIAVLPQTVINDNKFVYQVSTNYFNSLGEFTTPVYTAKTNMTTPSKEVPVMAKYQNGATRRVISAFDFSSLPIIPSDNPHMYVVANAIVNWLFDITSIEESGTSLTSNNGLLLYSYPNPVTSISDIIVQNTNEMPVSAKVYLLDMAGSNVMNLFDGTLNIDDNVFKLSNNNLMAGKYFIVSETASGKNYIPIVISK